MEPLLLNNPPWIISKRVLPQHTDHAGVAWHGAYLAWLEEARIDALACCNLLYKELSSEGFELPVVNLEINYLKTIIHGEEIVLKSWALPKKGVRWPWYTKILTAKGEVAAEASVQLVLIQMAASGRRVLKRPPDKWKEIFLDLQKGPFKSL